MTDPIATGLVPGAHAFHARLSARELEIASAAAAGLYNKQIANNLAISVRTVENHLRSIYAKVGVTTRTQLSARIYAAQLSSANLTGGVKEMGHFGLAFA